jgi:nitronate monooxygenase
VAGIVHRHKRRHMVGVGFITWSMAKRRRLLDLVLERRPPAVMLSFGEVQPHAQKIKKAGALLICQVQTLEQAKNAAANDADILVAQGTEGGGHGVARSTFPFVPAVADAVPHIPIAAAGGVADGRGLAAALMLGADGVLVGTRFYASQEAAGFATAKDRIVSGTGDHTIRGILFDIARRNVWPAPYTGRVLRNSFSEKWRGRQAELLQHQDGEADRYSKARANGDFDTAAVIAGIWSIGKLLLLPTMPSAYGERDGGAQYGRFWIKADIGPGFMSTRLTN